MEIISLNSGLNDSINLDNATGMTIQGHPDGTSRVDSVRLIGCSDVHINRVKVTGTQLYGVHFQNCNFVSVSHCAIENANKACVYLDGSKNVDVRENTWGFRNADGMKVAGCEGVLIENNFSNAAIDPNPGEHCDFIQFQGSNSSDIIIRGNVCLPGNDRATEQQGIFFDDAHYSHVLIEDNIIVTGMLRGISISSGDNILVRRNTVLDVIGYGSKATKIIVPSGSDVRENIVGTYRYDAPIKNGNTGPNLYIQQESPSGPFFYDDYFKNARQGISMTLEDLRPVEGSLAETIGAIQRWNELMEPTPEPEPEPTPEPEFIDVVATLRIRKSDLGITG